MTKNPEEGVATERPQDSPPAVEEKEPPSFHTAEQPTEHPPPATPQETKRPDHLTEPENSLQPTPNPAITNGEENDENLQQTDDTEDQDRLQTGGGEDEEVGEQKAGEGEQETEQEEKLEEEGEEEAKEEQNADEKEGEKEEEEKERHLEEGKEEDDQEETKEEDKEQEEEGEDEKAEEKVDEQEEKGEEEDTVEDKEQKQTREEETEEEKGDDSQLSGTDVSSMDGKGDSTEISPRRETSDLKAEGNENEPVAESKPEANGPTGDGDHTQSPTPEAAAQPSPRDSRTEEESAPVEETEAKGEEETGEQAAVENTSETPAPHYEDDFSETSEMSDRGAAVTTEAAGAAAEEAKPEVSKSPTPSTEESRAERGSVVPVPVTAQKKSRDGRSFVEERGERRGEDRSEVPCEEGVDSRGQGQWKSEEKLFLESSLANQHAEKEALQAVIDDKVKVQKEFDDLKNRYMTLEEKSRRWEEDTSSLKQACQDQNTRIKELEEEQTRLKAFEQWGKDNEARIKDLQDRLGTLAGEDADKDRRIQKLQEELQDTRSRLVTAERQVAVNNEASQQRPAQQSKTCTIL